MTSSEKTNENKLKLFLKDLLSKKGTKTFISSIIAILLGILLGIIIMIISNPKNSLQGIRRLLFTPLIHHNGIATGIGQVLAGATPIILTGLAVGFAFKTGVFNIGASGQYMMGLFAASVVGILGNSLGFMQWPLAVLAGGLAGAIWGAIPGALKAFFNVNVVITGIMLNYVAVFFINGLIGGPLSKYMLDGATNRTPKVRPGARTPYFFLDKIFPRSGVDFSFIIAILLVILVFIILTKTVFGRELKSVGLNRHAAKYAGVNENFAIIISMAISGFFAGLAGAFYILAPGARGLGNNYSRENVVLPAGFNGIPVALLGSNHPIGLFFAALFISYIQTSGIPIQSVGYARELVDVVIAVILYFSAFALIIGQFLERYIKKRKEKQYEPEEENQ